MEDIFDGLRKDATESDWNAEITLGEYDAVYTSRLSTRRAVIDNEHVSAAVVEVFQKIKPSQLPTRKLVSKCVCNLGKLEGIWGIILYITWESVLVYEV